LFTVLGHSGFVGRRLAVALEAAGEEVFRPRRDASDIASRALGHVIDCRGNDRGDVDPLGVIEANVGAVRDVLSRENFSSYLYLSTTRLYQNARETHEEADIEVAWNDPQRLFVLSKLAGEALCLADRRPEVRVVRLSNVYGCNPASHYFLPTLMRDALSGRQPDLWIAPESSKDYVAIDDVVSLLPRIAQSGRHRIYNLASGREVTAGEIVARLEAATGATARWRPDGPFVASARIDVSRITEEFEVNWRELMDDLDALIEETRNEMSRA